VTTAAEEAFLRSLRATFKIEAAEHLQHIGTGLLELEKAAAPAEHLEIIETVFRAAHSLKGASRAVNLTEIESLCQSLEELFAAWKRRESRPNPPTLDAAHRAVDEISNVLFGGIDQTSPQPVPTPAGDTETVRITVGALDARLLEAEEMLGAKLAADQRASDLGVLAGQFGQWRKEWARLQPRTRALRQALEQPREGADSPDLRGLSEFFDWNHDYLRALEAKVTALRRTAEQDRLLV
jgi:two-component system, chemotaxis family, sensor kinase CheA